MKRIVLPLVLIVTGSMFAASCKKESSMVGTNNNGKNSYQSTARMTEANYAFDADEICDQPGANCHSVPPIIITPECLGALADAEAGGKVVVGSVFNSQDLASVCAEMTLGLEAMLKSGNYYIKKNYEDGVWINYMVGTTYPVTVQNMTTAFQLHK